MTVLKYILVWLLIVAVFVTIAILFVEQYREAGGEDITIFWLGPLLAGITAGVGLYYDYKQRKIH